VSCNLVDCTVSVLLCAENVLFSYLAKPEETQAFPVVLASQALCTLTDMCQGEDMLNQEVVAKRRRVFSFTNEVFRGDAANLVKHSGACAPLHCQLRVDSLRFLLALGEGHPRQVVVAMLQDIDLKVIRRSFTEARSRVSDTQLDSKENLAEQQKVIAGIFSTANILQGTDPEPASKVQKDQCITDQTVQICYLAFTLLVTLKDFSLEYPNLGLVVAGISGLQFELHQMKTKFLARTLESSDVKPRKAISRDLASSTMREKEDPEEFVCGDQKWNFERAFASVAASTGTVEILYEGKVEIVYFRLPPISKCLSSVAVTNMLHDPTMNYGSPPEKLEGFLRLIDRVATESTFRLKVKGGPWWISWVAGPWSHVAWVAFYLAVLMNLIMLMSYVHRSGGLDDLNEWQPGTCSGIACSLVFSYRSPALRDSGMVYRDVVYYLNHEWFGIDVTNVVRVLGVCQIASAFIITVMYAGQFGWMAAATKMHRAEQSRFRKHLSGAYNEFQRRGQNFSSLSRMEQMWWVTPKVDGLEERRPGWSGPRVFAVQFYYLVTEPLQLYYLTYLLCSLLGFLYRSVFYAFLLLDVVQRFTTLWNVFLCIRKVVATLLLLIVFLGVVVYLYSWWAFLNFDYYYDEELDTSMYCDTLLNCFLSTIQFGVTRSAGISEAIAPAKKEDPDYYARFVFDISFFFFVMVLIRRVEIGVIVDTFSERRQEMDKARESRQERCFICNLHRSVFDQIATDAEHNGSGVRGFERHISSEHIMEAYINYIIYLKDRDFQHCTGVEKFCKKQIAEASTKWFPVNKAKSLQRAGVKLD